MQVFDVRTPRLADATPIINVDVLRAPRLMAFANAPQEFTLTLSAPYYLQQFLMFALRGLLKRARTRTLTVFVSGIQ